MPKTKYPRLGTYHDNRPAKGLCWICNQPQADTKVDIQVDQFRGNDIVAKVHWTCFLGLKDRSSLAIIVAWDAILEE